MDGKEAIIAKITENAKVSADNLIRDAQNELAEAETAARLSAEKTAKEMSERLDEECERIVRRKITLANLDARKLVLAQKQEILTQTYAEAQEKLVADKKNYAAFMARLVEENAEEGDEVIAGEEDKAVFTAKWLAGIKKLPAKVTMCTETHGGRGVILRGVNSDKNLTLDAVFAEAKERTEQKTAEILFGETK